MELSLEMLSSMVVWAVTNAVYGYIVAYCNCLNFLTTGLIQYRTQFLEDGKKAEWTPFFFF